MKVFFFIALFVTLLTASNRFATRLESASTDGDAVALSLNLTLLRQENNSAIEIDLDEATTVTLYKTMFKREDSKNFSWFGENRQEHIEAVFSVRNALLAGSVFTQEGSYEIRPKNAHYILQKNPSQNAINSLEGDTVFLNKRAKDLNLHVNSPTPQSALELNSTEVTIDVMLFYTAEFKKNNGDVADAVAQNLFDVAYGAYKRSLTNINLNLVYLKQLPIDSVLNDTSHMFTSLEQLKVDGYVRELRKRYRADMVSLIGRKRLSNKHCGIADRPSDPDSGMIDAFSIIFNGLDRSGYCSNLILAHEMGHNFGCAHDSDHGGEGMYAYSHGYDIADKFATIMSYDEPNIRYFSNPDILDTIYNVPIGDAQTADNARTIRDNRFKMADNSKYLDDSLEPSDQQNGLDIEGYLTSYDDRDSYFVTLGGATRFNGDNIGYQCWYFYLYLYNANHEFMFRTDADSGTDCGYAIDTDLDNGTYEMVVYGGEWQEDGETTHYKINIETSYEPAEVNRSAVYDTLIHGEFDIAGRYSMYDFDNDGQGAFDWVFQTPEGKTYRLQGEAPTDENIFGWKLVNVRATEPSYIMSYLGDYDADGDSRFDWIVIDLSTKAVYKLEGVTKEGNFKYSDNIEITPILSDNTLRFEAK
jgi:hypothetical protein